MKNFLKVLPVALVLTLSSCTKDQKADQLVIDQDVATMEAPVVDAQTVTSETAPAQPLTNIALSESQFDFGKIKKGEQKEHVYEVTNTGENPLIISQVKPACGCTVPDYTKEPILPGQKGKITLKFDSSSFDGLVNKQAEVYANVEKAPIVLTFTADIQP